MSYTFFADYYDKLTNNVGYKKIADFICSFFERYNFAGASVLDVACGTASLTVELSKRGYDMIGADRSFEMLSAAQQKACDEEANILFLNQSAEKLDLYGTVNCAVCTLDSLNHITDFKKLTAALKRISLFIEPGGLFIFDMNTPYKHNCVLADNTFVYETDDVMCVWQNSTDFKKSLTNIKLDFFEKNEEGLYIRSQESFSEAAYKSEDIELALKEAKLEIIDIYDNYTLNKPCGKTERLVYITKKI